MGLFSNKKKLCPLCGGPTPRLLATKVENMPLCKDCADKIDLPSGALERMSLEDLRQYMAFYDQNQWARLTFTETYRYSFGFLSDVLVLDGQHRLLRLKGYDGALVLEAQHLAAFRITEDERVLFEGKSGVLTCHPSTVPERVQALAPAIERFNIRHEEYERMEEMERHMGRRDDRPLPPEPAFDTAAPLHQFHVELTLNHPYWKSFRAKVNAPDFSKFHPSAADYLREYEEKAEELHKLAANLLHIMDPNGREQHPDTVQAAQTSAAAPVADAVAEIQRYKGLLDAGVITEAEFTAKKRQLMGI